MTSHDPGKIIADLTMALALGGDCLADIALLREEPAVFGRVASDPTAPRLIAALAADAPKALAAIDSARSAARRIAWSAAGNQAPDHEIDAGQPLIIDIDATLVIAHSEKEKAAATYKRGFGFHPLCAFVDHGPDVTGEPLAMMLRPGDARLQHRRRPHRSRPTIVAADAVHSHGWPGRPQGADPHRRGGPAPMPSSTT